MTLPLPNPPYPCRAGMSWDMDSNCVFIFDGTEPVMAVSISEIVGELKKLDRQRKSATQQAEGANQGAEGQQ